MIRAALSSALSSAPWVGTLALSACAVAPEPVAETLPPGPERARRALDALVDGLALRSPGATLAHVAEVWTVEGRFHHLRARVAVPGALGLKTAVSPEGRPWALDDAERDLGRRHAEHWGRIDRSLAARLLGRSMDEVQTVGIWLADAPDAEGSAAGSDPSGPGAAGSGPAGSADLASQRHRRWEPMRLRMRDRLLAAGFEDVRMAAPLPLLTARASRARIEAIRGWDGIGVIEDASAGGTPFAAAHAQDNAAYHSRSASSLNAAGWTGKDVKVGILEGFKGGCELTEEHEAFDFTPKPFDYLSPPKSCTTDAECECSADLDSFCVGGRCRTVGALNPGTKGHTTQVASRIAASAGGAPLHAAKARLYVANDTAVDQAAELVAAYQSFTQAGVGLINQSFGPPPIWHVLHHVMNWVSYVNRLTLVQATANGLPGGNGEICGNGEQSHCAALNTLCVGAVDAADTWGPTEDDTLWGASRWRNPVSRLSVGCGGPMDAERPDVVSEGASARVANTDAAQNKDWVLQFGTSFAAPVVTGSLALFTEKCVSRGFGAPGPELARALVRTAAIAPHGLGAISDPLYPWGGWARGPRDARHGTGIHTADMLDMWCEPQTPADCETGCPGPLVQGDLADPAIDWQPLEPWMTLSTEPRATTRGDYGTALGTLMDGSPKLQVKLAELGDFVAGERLRLSLSFATCPQGAIDVEEPSMPRTTDYDLLFCSRTTQDCHAVSESLDDTNEGFDWFLDPAVVGANELQDMVVYLVRPEATSPCTLTGVPFEPYAATWVVWKYP